MNVHKQYPRAYINVLKAIHARNFIVAESLYETEPVSPSVTQELAFKFEHKLGQRTLAFVYFGPSSESDEAKRVIKGIWSDVLKKILADSTITDAIFLVRNELSAGKVVTRTLGEKMVLLNLTVFTLDEMLMDLPNHVLVPEVSLVDPEEYAEVLKTTDEDDIVSRFPIAYHTDALVKYYSFKPGDVIRIYQRQINRIVYRYVVSAV
jgi:DNA-directed RNA polymerase subunit H (RpoH/RPB5)